MAKFVILCGIKQGNRFFSTHIEGKDPTKLLDGTVAYTVLKYVDSVFEAQKCLFGEAFALREQSSRGKGK